MSTDVGALMLTDSAKVETVQSLTPYAANPWLHNQLGQVYGVPIGSATNTSVYLVFSGPAGLTIPKGFTVTDGTFQYALRDGGIINAGLTTDPLFAVATVSGSWAVPAGTVTGFVTSPPPGIGLAVVNPLPGTPGIASGETQESYRSRVLDAGLAASQGVSRYLKTLLGNVPGAQKRLISARLLAGVGWQILCGGGDPYDVAGAIFDSMFYLPGLVGSTIGITGITSTNPAVVTTNLNHGLATGQTGVGIVGVTPGGFNAANQTVTVISETTFSYPLDATALTYTSGGHVTPNPRNIVVSISDYPDVYSIPFVNPPEQTVTMTVTWNTDSPNVVSPAAIAQLAIPALVAYVNAIPVGQPINVLVMNAVFQAAVAPILASALLSKLVFAVSINGVSTAVSSGTSLVVGDPESFFVAVNSGMTVNQG